MKTARALASIALAALLLSASASAATKTWVGGGSNNFFSNPLNWDSGVPANGDSIRFTGPGTYFQVNIDVSNLVLDSIVADAPGGVGFVGNALTLAGSQPVTTLSGVLAFGVDVVFASQGATLVNSGASGISFGQHHVTFSGGTVNLDAGSDISAYIYFDSSIGESAPTSFATRGNVSFAGDSSFTGTVQSNGNGQVRLYKSAGLGSASGGTVIRDNTTLSLQFYGAGDASTAEPISLAGYLAFGNLSVVTDHPPFRFTGPIQLTARQLFNLFSDTTFEGPIGGAGEFETANLGSGSPVMTLANPGNNFTGDVWHGYGTLRLGANEVIPDSARLTLWPGTALEVGDHAETVRLLDCRSEFRITLGGQLRVREPSTLYFCTLRLTIPAGYVAPSTPIILVRNESNTRFNGDFLDLPEGTRIDVNGATRVLTYTGGAGYDIALIPVPTASQLVLASVVNTLYATPNSVISGFGVRALDAGGAGVSGVPVTFTLPAGCGSFNGASSTVATSTAGGVAVSPSITAAATPRTCVGTATTSAGGHVDYTVVTLGPSDVALSVAPTAITVTENAPISFVVTLKTAQGAPLKLSLMEVTISGSSNGAFVSPQVISDANNGTAVVSGHAGAGNASYAIVVSFAGASIQVPITQAARPAPVASQLVAASIVSTQYATPNTLISGYGVRALDASGLAVPGSVVTFSLPAGCGSFNGASTVSVTADANGLALSPQITSAPTVRSCTVTVSTGAGGRVEYTVVTLGPSDVVITVAPESLTVTEMSSIAFNVRLKTPQGAPLTLALVTASITGTSNGAYVVPSTVTSPNDGIAVVSGIAGQGSATYTVVVSFAGASVQVPVTQVLRTAPSGTPTRSVSGSATGGMVTLTLVSGGGDACSLEAVSFPADSDAELPPTAPPPGLVFPNGLVSWRARDCAVGSRLTLRLDLPSAPRADAVLMRHGRTQERPSGTWYILPPANVVGNSVLFDVVDGGGGDGDLQANGFITSFVGMAQAVKAPPVASSVDYTDLWWAGSAENGWGMSIVQHADVLFGVIYGYGASGSPEWYVMSGGTWNANHTAFTGELYLTRGSPYHSYSASSFVPGTPVGSVTLTFSGPNTATLAYTLQGVVGTKSISRQMFGVQTSAVPGAVGDMWWGGASQNGWGVAVLQQYRALFAVWFTYDDGGAPTWFVMPDGTWTAEDTYEGRVYRTTGSRWAAPVYNPAALQVIDVGSFKLRFARGGDATLEYSINGRNGVLPLSRQPY